MELVQARLVTDDVAGLAAFYAGLVRAEVPLNEYYVEVPAGPMTVGFSKRRFTEYREEDHSALARLEVLRNGLAGLPRGQASQARGASAAVSRPYRCRGY